LRDHLLEVWQRFIQFVAQLDQLIQYPS